MPSIDCNTATADKHSNGAVVSAAGDAFITLPPMVPVQRVAAEPTIELASAIALKLRHTNGSAMSES